MKALSPEGKPILGTPELARAIGVTDKTLARWRLNGKGPEYHQLGRRVFYRRESVIAWMERRGAIDWSKDGLGDLREPYNQGYEAAKAGSSRESCPHMTVIGEFKLRTAWCAGWWQYHDEQGAANEAA